MYIVKSNSYVYINICIIIICIVIIPNIYIYTSTHILARSYRSRDEHHSFDQTAGVH